MKELIVQKTSQKVYDFFSHFVNVEGQDTLVISTSDEFNILNHPSKVTGIINLSPINDVRYINKFFECINSILVNNDAFIGCVETFQARKQRNAIQKIPILRSFYYVFEFIFLRIFPKVWGLKKVYFFFTHGRNRLLSKAEALGRLVSCGFKILDYETIDGLLYFVVEKEKEPAFNMEASYGPLFKMNRIGRNGKKIGVYKFRTMHPYAEYLQDYILTIHGYAKTGKPANDFRLTPWGKFMRRYWIDEIPQLINVLKGEMKLVGVRPVSERYFQDIPKEIQDLRLTQKPGCIPPYVSLNRKGNKEAVLQAEKEYLKTKVKYPYTTDIKFFFKAVLNIVFKGKRSA